MRPFTSTISLEEARRRLDAAVRPIARTERVRLEDAAGRVAAADVTSPIDVPPFARSAMDGYAVIAADTAGATRSTPARLRLLDRIYTGQPSSITIERGTCAEIATGAPLPGGRRRRGDGRGDRRRRRRRSRSSRRPRAGQHVGRRGADIAAGRSRDRRRRSAVAQPDRRDRGHRPRRRRGVREAARRDPLDRQRSDRAGRHARAGADLRRQPLHARRRSSRRTAASPSRTTPAQDTVAALIDALDACAAADLIVFSGGSSVGERDLVVDAIAARGEMIFHGIAVRPGKPTAFATIGAGRSTPFFGMPGNPTSCLSNAYILLVPFLRALARLPPHAPRTVRAPLGRRIASAVNRHQFYTVRLRDGVAFPAFKGSGDITSLSQADGYIEIPADQSVVEEGASVTVTLF